MDIEKAILLNLVLDMVSLVFQADHLIDFWACDSEVKLFDLFVRMQILSHCRNTHTVYNTYTQYTYRARAYCKLQKLLPLAKLISKYASWHLMPSVTEVRGHPPDSPGGLKFDNTRISITR